MKTASALGWAGFVAIFGAACGITVTLPGQTGEMTGTGGGAASSADSSGQGGAVGNGTGSGETPPSDCATTCSVPPSGETCKCAADCSTQGGGAFEKISCAPITDLQGNHKVECVCSVQDFSGVCFEKHLENLCSFADGCCAKYFSGK